MTSRSNRAPRPLLLPRRRPRTTARQLTNQRIRVAPQRRHSLIDCLLTGANAYRARVLLRQPNRRATTPRVSTPSTMRCSRSHRSCDSALPLSSRLPPRSHQTRTSRLTTPAVSPLHRIRNPPYESLVLRGLRASAHRFRHGMRSCLGQSKTDPHTTSTRAGMASSSWVSDPCMPTSVSDPGL